MPASTPGAATGLDVNTEIAALIPDLRNTVRNSHADAVILAIITEIRGSIVGRLTRTCVGVWGL